MPDLPYDPEPSAYPTRRSEEEGTLPAPESSTRRYPRALAAIYPSQGARPLSHRAAAARQAEHGPGFVRRSPPPPLAPAPLPVEARKMVQRALLRQDAAGSMAFDVDVQDPMLGALTCTIAVREGRAVATFSVTDANARRLLEAELPRLQSALRGRGMKVDGLSVVVASEMS